MQIIKKHILIGLCLLSGAAAIAKPEYSYNLPLPGETIGNEKLQYDTLMPVYAIASARVPDCEKYFVSNTKVTRKPYDLKTQNGNYVDGKWEELWTVSACRSQVFVPIRFILDSTGASWAISNRDVKVSDK